MSKKEKEPRGKLPSRFVPVGETIVRYGQSFKCVERPPIDTLHWTDACKGCWFAKTHHDRMVSNCNAIQCSSWDRKDGKNVWFKLVEG